MKITLKITPNAKKNECVGWEDDPRAGRVLKVRVAAPPVEGKANKAIIAFLSDLLDIPKSKIDILKGETGRLKTLDLPDDADLSKTE